MLISHGSLSSINATKLKLSSMFVATIKLIDDFQSTVLKYLHHLAKKSMRLCGFTLVFILLY